MTWEADEEGNEPFAGALVAEVGSARAGDVVAAMREFDESFAVGAASPAFLLRKVQHRKVFWVAIGCGESLQTKGSARLLRQAPFPQRTWNASQE